VADNPYFQLVDTKSSHNSTLLDFLERIISKHFPDMETFLDELDSPAQAYRSKSFRKPVPSTS
jgi:cytokinesis protein